MRDWQLARGAMMALLSVLAFVGFHETSDWIKTGQAAASPPSSPVVSEVKGIWVTTIPIPTRGSQTPAPSTPTASASPSGPAMQQQLAAYVEGLDGRYGVAIRNIKDGQTALIDADRVFPAASLYKVLVMYRVYQAIERGELKPGDTVVFTSDDLAESENGDGLSPGDTLSVEDALDWMITFSSNPAAYALAREVGGWNQVLEGAKELGMKSTTWDGDTFVSTPLDMMHFFELLAKRSLVSPAASDRMIGVLLRQEYNDRLPAKLPPGTMVAHKTGELPEVRNDAGIVFAPKGPFVIAIMSEGIDPANAAHAESEISRLAYDRFGG